MAFIGFNVEQFVNQSHDRFWVVGRAPIVITDVYAGTSMASQAYIKVVIEATGGENLGRRESLFCMLEHENPIVIQLGKRRLASIAKALGITYLEDPIKQFRWQHLVVNVGSRVDKKTQKLVNTFEQFEQLKTAAPDGMAQLRGRYGYPTKGRPMTPVDPRWTDGDIADDLMPSPS